MTIVRKNTAPKIIAVQNGIPGMNDAGNTPRRGITIEITVWIGLRFRSTVLSKRLAGTLTVVIGNPSVAGVTV
jgi:hypothetical protein